MAIHVIPLDNETIDQATTWAAENMDAERFDQLSDLDGKNTTEKASMVPDGNAVSDLLTEMSRLAQNAGYKLGGFVLLDSESELPANPADKTIGYLIDGDLYLWVGTGGDTADGKYQNCGPIQGPAGTGDWDDIANKPDLAYLGANEGSVSPSSFDPEADTVHIAAQELSSAQKQQVRTNIGAAGVNDIVGIQIVNHGTSDTTYEMAPNKFHIWGEVSSLTLTLGTGESGYVQEYLFQFTSGSTATTLSLPSSLKWINGVEPSNIEADHTYQVSILNGIGVIGGVSDE